MKIALIQFQSAKGDVQTNIGRHLQWTREASKGGADLIVFPELSLTGYEPTLAAALATDSTDKRFQELQACSDEHHVIICVGMPIRQPDGISISMLIFQPGLLVSVYSKKHLHADEIPWFVPANNLPLLSVHDQSIAFSICYELSIDQHAADASQAGAAIYLSSSVKTARGVEQAHQRLANIALHYRMNVLFVNSIGPSDDFIGAGQSSAWNASGELLGVLSTAGEGMLLTDTDNLHNCIIKTQSS